MTTIDEAVKRLRRYANPGDEGINGDIAVVLDALDTAEWERDEALAVIERAEDYITRHYFDTQMGTNALTLLVGAPADALRAVRAEAWDEAITAVQGRVGEGGLLDQHRLIRLPNPYRNREETPDE